MSISVPLLRLWSISRLLIFLGFIFFVLTISTLSVVLASSLDREIFEYDITVQIDPAAQTIEGHNIISTKSTHELILVLNSRFKVGSILIDGIALEQSSMKHGMMQTWQIPGSHSTPRRIEIYWQGKFSSLNTSLNHRQTLNRSEPVSGEFGTFLPDSSGWYPHIIGELASYRVSLKMPHGQRGVVAGKIVEESNSNEGYHAFFEFPFPSEGIDFMGGPYTVETDSMYGIGGKKIQLRTYFHPEIKELAHDYLNAVKKYIKFYESWIGAYPFTEFSVISSPTPTGFGMPTLTYLGINVLQLPFIRNTSLGHEVLHNWWGNGVYPYYPGGNWSEGLTTFMADYTYKERMSPEAAKEMRLGWLRDFGTLSSDQDFALEKFTSRTHGASKIIGYNKAAMIFLMLRDMLGNKNFDRGLKLFWSQNQFRMASWSDLQRAFESESGQKLQEFFEQWLTNTGAPSVRIVKAAHTHRESGHEVTVTLKQAGSSYNLRVPVAVHTKESIETKILNLNQENQTFSFELPSKPIKLTLDPDFRLFRKLTPDEAPPILRQIMVSQNVETILLPEEVEGHEIAKKLAGKLLRRTPKIATWKNSSKVTSVLVIGIQNQVRKWLDLNKFPSRPTNMRRDGTAHAWTIRQDGITIIVVSAKDASSLQALVRPLPHYGRQSYVVFDGAKVVERGTWPAHVQEILLN